jgi:hypothetical protein
LTVIEGKSFALGAFRFFVGIDQSSFAYHAMSRTSHAAFQPNRLTLFTTVGISALLHNAAAPASIT